VDEQVSAVAVALLRREDLSLMLAPDTGPDLDRMVVESNETRARMDEAAGLFASGAISGAQLSTITLQLREVLDGLEARISRAGSTTALSPFLASTDAKRVWDELNIDRRRAVVRELMEVTILPGRGGKDYRPELTRITPRVPEP
jgi:hypothetical protein